MFAVICVMTVLTLTYTPVGSVLEQSMVTNMLGAYPISIAIGFLSSRALTYRYTGFLERINGGGIPGVVLASFVLAFWMIPRWD